MTDKEKFKNRLRYDERQKKSVAQVKYALKMYTDTESVEEAIASLNDSEQWEMFISAINAEDFTALSIQWRTAFDRPAGETITKDVVLRLGQLDV